MDPHNEDQEAVPNSAYNPFPEPQTIPAGWDLSGLPSAPAVDSADTVEDGSKEG